MKREILIVTVLMTNIAFSATLPVKIREIKEIDVNKNKISSLAEAASIHLHKKGLDQDIADQKVLKALSSDEHVNALMVQNIVNNFDNIKREDIIAYIGSCALYEKSVNFSSYDNIVALVQKTDKLMLDKVTLEKIEKICLENKNIKSLYKVS